MLGYKVSNALETPINFLTGVCLENEPNSFSSDISIYHSMLNGFSKIIENLTIQIESITPEEAKEIYSEILPMISQLEFLSKFLMKITPKNPKEIAFIKCANNLANNIDSLISSIREISTKSISAKAEHEELKNFILSRKNPAFAKYL